MNYYGSVGLIFAPRGAVICRFVPMIYGNDNYYNLVAGRAEESIGFT